jgi:hypothetical protein
VAALRGGTVRVATGERAVVRTVSDEGAGQFVELNRPGWRGLVWLRDGGRSRTTIMAVKDPAKEQVLAAAFDARWLVFGVGHDLSDPNDWTLYSWDSRAGGPPREIAHNRDRGPWLAPVVHAGRAAWISGAGVHVYDLARGTGRVVHEGVANTVFFFGSMVVWRAGYDDVPASLQAADPVTGAAVALPGALREVRSGHYAAADDTTVVWTLADGRTVQAWRAGWATPRRVVTLADGLVEWPKVTGDLVTFGDTAAHFVADLRSGSYVQVTPRYGWTDTWGDALLVQYEPTSQALTSTLVRASRLRPLPSCA